MARLPFVSAALLCDSIIREQGGPLSAIRIIDTLTLDLQPPGLLPGAIVASKLTVLIGVKSEEPVDGTITLKLLLPDGTIKSNEQTWPLRSEGGAAGANLHLTMMTPFPAYGLYWIKVFWNGSPLTAIPFNVAKPSRTATAPAAPRS